MRSENSMTALSLIRSRKAKCRSRSAIAASSVWETVEIFSARFAAWVEAPASAAVSGRRWGSSARLAFGLDFG